MLMLTALDYDMMSKDNTMALLWKLLNTHFTNLTFLQILLQE